MKCPRCGKHKAIEDRNYGILPCKVCQKEDEKFEMISAPEFYTLSKADRVITERDKHGKDILQPFGRKGAPDPDFAQAYPDKVDDYYDESQKKKL